MLRITINDGLKQSLPKINTKANVWGLRCPVNPRITKDYFGHYFWWWQFFFTCGHNEMLCCFSKFQHTISSTFFPVLELWLWTAECWKIFFFFKLFQIEEFNNCSLILSNLVLFPQFSITINSNYCSLGDFGNALMAQLNKFTDMSKLANRETIWHVANNMQTKVKSRLSLHISCIFLIN